MDNTVQPEALAPSPAPMLEPASEPQVPSVPVSQLAESVAVSAPTSFPAVETPFQAPFKHELVPQMQMQQPHIAVIPVPQQPLLHPTAPLPTTYVSQPMSMPPMMAAQHPVTTTLQTPAPESAPVPVKPKELKRKPEPEPVKRRGPPMNLAQLENAILWEVS